MPYWRACRFSSRPARPGGVGPAPASRWGESCACVSVGRVLRLRLGGASPAPASHIPPLLPGSLFPPGLCSSGARHGCCAYTMGCAVSPGRWWSPGPASSPPGLCSSRAPRSLFLDCVASEPVMVVAPTRCDGGPAIPPGRCGFRVPRPFFSDCVVLGPVTGAVPTRCDAAPAISPGLCSF